MTIDVGYAHLALPDGERARLRRRARPRPAGRQHARRGRRDRRGAARRGGRRRAAGPDASSTSSCSTRLGVTCGLAVVTQGRPRRSRATTRRGERALDAVAPARADVAGRGARSLAVSAIDAARGSTTLRAALVELRDRVLAGAARWRRPTRRGWPSIASSRSGVAGRSSPARCAAGRSRAGRHLRLVPRAATAAGPRGSRSTAAPVETVAGGGRTALNLAGVDRRAAPRPVLTADPGVVATTDCSSACPPAPAERRSVERRGRAWPPTGAPSGSTSGRPQAEAVVGAVRARCRRPRVRRGRGRGLRLDRVGRGRRRRPVRAAAAVARRRSIAGGDRARPAARRPVPRVGGARRSGCSRSPGHRRRREPGPAAALLDLHGALPIARWRAPGWRPRGRCRRGRRVARARPRRPRRRRRSARR